MHFNGENMQQAEPAPGRCGARRTQAEQELSRPAGGLRIPPGNRLEVLVEIERVSTASGSTTNSNLFCSGATPVRTPSDRGLPLVLWRSTHGTNPNPSPAGAPANCWRNSCCRWGYHWRELAGATKAPTNVGS